MKSLSMSFDQIASIAGDILVIGGAIAMILFACISIYVLIVVRKIHKIFKTIQSGYQMMQERIQIPMMLVTAFLAKQGIKDADAEKKIK